MARNTKYNDISPRILKQYWESGKKAHNANRDKVFSNISKRINQDKRVITLRVLPDSKNEKKRGSFLVSLIKYAAVLILLSAGVFLIFKEINYNNSENTVVQKNIWIKKTNPKGRKSTIGLSDGTMIRLNAESVLFYPEHFDSDHREIHLIGEAWFDVAHDEARPFIITSGNLKTTVLGTEFNIRAFPEDEFIEVALKSGKVQIDIEGNLKFSHMILRPNEVVRYDKYEQIVHKEVFDPAELLGWKDGIIVLKDAGFEEILSRLERWYNVEILVEGNRHINTRFTGSFTNKSLEHVLEGIGFSCNFEYRIDDKTVTIKKTDVKLK